MSDPVESLARRFEMLRPHLSELQRRLWLGVEAGELGPGGVGVVARAVGVAADTVRRGRVEAQGLDSASVVRSRRPGGGRKRAEAHDGALVAALEALIDPATGGDPMSAVRWTSKSTRALARALTDQGHPVSDFVVRRLLKDLGYSLQANPKTTEGGQHLDRDAQFGYLSDTARVHMVAGNPVISVDTKKKLLVGQYKNGGREWSPAGEPTAADTGWVAVGTDHDTAQFAVATIARWWTTIGAAGYPGATGLLICADGGGSNGYRTRMWKTELADLAARTGLRITVAHLPPGTSRWNKIEHRMFSHISMNWRGRPLTSHEVIVATIAATTTRSGLLVHAEFDTAIHPTGVTIPDTGITDLEASGILTRATFHGEWNYTLNPPFPDTPDTRAELSHRRLLA